MKRYLIVALFAAILTSGCMGTVSRSFTVTTDPPDAIIRIVSGAELEEDEKYNSPASVTVEVPSDPALSSKAVLEVKKDGYKPLTILLRTIKDEENLNLKLEKVIRSAFRYRLQYRLVAPAVSDTLQFKDSNVSVSFKVAEQAVQMKFDNYSQQDLKILWDRAEYTDVNSQPHRIMHNGIRYQDRNNSIPPQAIPASSSVQVSIIPIDKIFYTQQNKEYGLQPLFPLDNEVAAGLKGRSFNLFIPVEVNRAIIPYNFKFEITDAIKEKNTQP